MIWGYVDDVRQIAGVLLGLAGLLAWLTAEAVSHRRALAAVPVRVHVGGSRGKTTVTRLIGGGLRAAGRRVLVKTTGTVPLLVLPDGSEQPWPRRGLPGIAEQSRLVRLAARLRVEVVVIESMAIQPEYLWASERYLVRASDTVITNLRPDHEEELGADPADLAAATALLVPTGGRLVLSEEAAVPALLAAAAARGSRVERVAADGIDEANGRLALAVCTGLGADPDLAAAGIRSAGADPGHFFTAEVETAAGRVRFANAFACNDVDSFLRLWRAEGASAEAVILFNGRADRPLRSRAFLTAFAGLGPGVRVVLAGAVPPAAVRAAGLDRSRLGRLRAREPAAVMAELAQLAGPAGEVWGTGNHAGLGARLAAAFRPGGT